MIKTKIGHVCRGQTTPKIREYSDHCATVNYIYTDEYSLVFLKPFFKCVLLLLDVMRGVDI